MSLQNPPIAPAIKLSLIWATTMHCYIYCDYFALYIPGKLQAIIDGSFGPLGVVDQTSLLLGGVLLIVPALMVVLSFLLRPQLSRRLNITVGIFYTILITLIAVQSRWHFYQLYAAIEAMLTAGAAWLAWKWPLINQAE